MSKRSHYPSYDVMKEKDEWDDHTQDIVSSRLKKYAKMYSFLSDKEADLLHHICRHLTGDDREELIEFVIHHIDQTLSSSVGEGQRKVGVPSGKKLIRLGLEAFDQSAVEKNGQSFVQFNPQIQQKWLTKLSEGQVFTSKWNLVPQRELFKKLLNLTLEAYYSHPQLWSEIGYGGPAYPRGYVRTQLGQLDPWEAQPEDE